MFDVPRYDDQDILTMRQAAALWEAIDPMHFRAFPSFLLPHDERSRLESRLSFLVSGVKAGLLEITDLTLLNHIGGDMMIEGASVTREALTRFAEAKKQRPPFLFPEERTGSAAPRSTEAGSSTQANTETVLRLRSPQEPSTVTSPKSSRGRKPRSELTPDQIKAVELEVENGASIKQNSEIDWPKAATICGDVEVSDGTIYNWRQRHDYQNAVKERISANQNNSTNQGNSRR